MIKMHFKHYELANKQISIEYAKTDRKQGVGCSSVTHSAGICSVAMDFIPSNKKITLKIIIMSTLLLLNIYQVLGTVFAVII